MLKQAAGYMLISYIAAVSIAVAGANSEMHVLESNVPEIGVGARVANEAMSNLPIGARVKVLLPSLKTKVFEGPSAGPTRSWGGTRGPKD